MLDDVCTPIAFPLPYSRYTHPQFFHPGRGLRNFVLQVSRRVFVQGSGASEDFGAQNEACAFSTAVGAGGGYGGAEGGAYEGGTREGGEGAVGSGEEC